MKRSIWNLLPVLLCLAALLCLSAMAGTALGEGITLTLEGGTLTISGVGTVPSDVLTRLTEEERACVTDVVIGEGITGIDGYALDPIGHQLRSIMIPASVTALGPNVLGTKGALDYTIYGDPETLRPLMSESNEDYGYFCTFKSAPSSMPDVPASAQVQGVVQEMGGLGVEMTLVKAAEASDNYGNVRYQYDYAVSSTYTVSLTSYDGERIGKVLIRVETLTPDETWTALCRGIAQTAALGLPDGLRQTLADIELYNGGGTAYAEVDGWDIRVGGVMDARSVWDLNRKDAMAHYTYD